MDDNDVARAAQKRKAGFLAMTLAAITASQATQSNERTVINEGGPLAANRFAARLLTGSERRFFELFRMTQTEFTALVEWVCENCPVSNTRYYTVELKVMLFLWIVAFNETQRNAAHFFGVSQSTVSRTVKQYLPHFVRLHTAFVVQPDNDFVAPEIELDPTVRHYSGAIGAIDGTHIHARVPVKDQVRWRNRKGWTSQNVFAAVKFDGSFSYVLAGAEGSMNDSRLLNLSLTKGFKIPENRYYLADAGFGMRKGIAVPFFRTRYHLQDWRESPNKPVTRKELYNLRHSRMRVKVEQAFGWLKRRSKLIRESAPEYSIDNQIDLVYACTGLYNFIHSQRYSHDDIPESERLFLTAAKFRADRTCAGRSSLDIRRRAALRTFDQWARVSRRRERRERRERNAGT
jgi:hypothetical protein